MTYRVQFSRRALKQLALIHPKDRERIRKFLENRIHGSDNPREIGRQLVSREEWRYRVGDYRILCHIHDEQLIVLVVETAHRREIYRKR